MVRRREHGLAVSLGVAALVLTTLGTGAATAAAEQPTNETAGLWADTPNECTPNATATEDEQAPIQILADCTDITFSEPPATAATWTEDEFTNLEAGGDDTSVYPSHVEPRDSGTIRDAHATQFGIHPSTRAHTTPDDAPLYIAPEGTVRGLVDYRVEVPDDREYENRTVNWLLLDHEIETVRLEQDDTVIASTTGRHTPKLRYNATTSGRADLTLAADIRVDLYRYTEPTDNETERSSRWITDTITVDHTVPVHVYDLSPTGYTTSYPDGETGVAVDERLPWNRIDFEDGSVRDNWRFFTARDPDWETLVEAGSDDTTRVDSDARPASVHAFPAATDGHTQPSHADLDVQSTWGYEHPSPAASLPEAVDVGVVAETYTRTHGIAIGHPHSEFDAVDVQGIVRGETATITREDADTRSVRESNLTVTVQSHTDTSATLRLELRDVTTDEPIVLADADSSRTRVDPIVERTREGYITIADQRVRTNNSGVATVTVHEPGAYAARYHPGPWHEYDPAYIGDTDAATWHPLLTLPGWRTFVKTLGSWLIPVAIIGYAGVLLGRLLHRQQ